MIFSKRKKSFEKHEKSLVHHFEFAISDLERAKQYLIYFKSDVGNTKDLWSVDTSIVSIDEMLYYLKAEQQVRDCTDVIRNLDANLGVVFQHDEQWNGEIVGYLVSIFKSLHNASCHIKQIELIRTKISAEIEW
ncbi:hypothetical protein [Vibrio sp. 16]|uniref:hypothetical protein n=1 Tax=Vibrio sp. 16 TaxID=391586 RepID=UPI00018F3DDF|nr:hypothetical protein [Vibrio sp. 16]EED26877.1 hypothetical protein VPMS16_2198 [Vibrio sp. 16]ELB2761133.1 hypothetical protein [Vibrio alginolyticus]CAK4074089.1 hypothetical protein VDT1_3202 [Vibrio sp. 16]